MTLSNALKKKTFTSNKVFFALNAILKLSSSFYQTKHKNKKKLSRHLCETVLSPCARCIPRPNALPPCIIYPQKYTIITIDLKNM